MKPFQFIWLLFFIPCSFYAQTKLSDEVFINANANASDKVTDHSTLDFYTADDVTLGTLTIPIHTQFSAMVTLIEGRAFLRVSSIKVGEEIHTVDWRVLGPDHKEGLPILDTDKRVEVYADQHLTFKAFPNE